MTATQLFARAMGTMDFGTGERCFYCGGECDRRHTSAEFVKPTFTGHSCVAFPESRYVCAGCVAAMNSQCRFDGYDKPQKVWSYSWVVSPAGAERYTKANLPQLTAACINPHEPPFAIAIADSGQKHQLYLAPVNHERETVTVVLECERITYRPCDLSERLLLCKRVAAAAGKPSLAEVPTHKLASMLAAYWVDWEQVYESWAAVAGEPCSRLAAWLCPKREDCQHDNPSNIVAVAPKSDRRRGATKEAGRAERPREEIWGGLFD